MTRLSAIGVGVVGTGSVAWFEHLPKIAESPDFRLLATCSRSIESAERARNHWHADASYAGAAELVSHPGVELVVIASPNAHHFAQASVALAAGKHVLIEKPMCATNTQAQALAREAKDRELVLAVGCHMRFWIQHRWARDLIDLGVIGDVRLIRTSLHESWHLYQENIAMSSFRTDPTQAVAGTMFDQASHRVDLMNFFAKSQPRRVTGIVDFGVNTELDPCLDDLGIGVVEYANGVKGVLTVDKFSPSVSNITEIYGSRGTIFASSEAINPFQSVPLAVYSDIDYSMSTLPRILRDYRYPDGFWVNDLLADRLTPRWTAITPPRNEPFADLYDAIAARIRGKDASVLPDADEAASVMEVVCGIMASSDAHSWLNLPLDQEYLPPALR